MAGYAGLVSVGQQAYVGFGGYMLFALTIFGGLPPVVAIAGAAVLGAAISIPVALLIFRLRGAYFCDRHLGYGRGVPFVFRPNISPRRRLWFLVTGQHRQVHRRQPINA